MTPENLKNVLKGVTLMAALVSAIPPTLFLVAMSWHALTRREFSASPEEIFIVSAATPGTILFLSIYTLLLRTKTVGIFIAALVCSGAILYLGYKILIKIILPL